MEKSTHEESYWWISFASDSKSLGAAVVQAESSGAALQRTIDLGINPGGEAYMIPCNYTQFLSCKMPLDTLFCEERLKELGHKKVSLLTPEENERMDEIAHVVERDQNEEMRKAN